MATVGYRRRKNIRLKGYDYSKNGFYYVTVCTHNRQTILSRICRGGVLLRPLGHIVKSEIKNTENRYGVIINPYIIMPDHVHMIVEIPYRGEREEQSPSPTMGIADIMCAFKSITTKKCNIFENCPKRQIWQRSYHDHIIRNEQDHFAITEYILNNPQNHTENTYTIKSAENFDGTEEK
ncbi:MAG: transposase [Clostridia bacterium]|nr:transposase [Clostridia bacterium]